MKGFDVGELECLLLVHVPILDLRGKCEVVPNTAESRRKRNVIVGYD